MILYGFYLIKFNKTLFIFKRNLFSVCVCFKTNPEGVRNISNQMSITRVDRGHPEIKDYARSRGWWDGEKEFDFAATYSYVNTARMTATRGRYCEGYKLLKKHEGIFES